MTCKVSGTTISLTRGDSLMIQVSILDAEGVPYVPKTGDKVRFAMNKKYTGEPLLVKDIPIDTMKLILEPKDTKDLKFGEYVYDIELTKANGEVDTFIDMATFILTEEVL